MYIGKTIGNCFRFHDDVPPSGEGKLKYDVYYILCM